MINYCAKRLSIFSVQKRVAWCVYSLLLLLLLLLSNQFFVIPICLVTFLQLWFSSRLLLSSSNQFSINIFQSFSLHMCLCVVHPSLYERISRIRVSHYCFDLKSRINIEWNVLGGHSRRWLLGGKEKNVNFNSRDSENVMVMPLEIEVLHTKLEWRWRWRRTSEDCTSEFERCQWGG